MPHRPALYPPAGPALLVAILLAALPARAAAHDPGCSDRVDPPARLACYDQHFPPAVSSDQAYRSRAQADFGKAGSDAANPVALDQLQATVRQVQQQGRLSIVELDNGQRWQVTEGRLPPMPAGTAVTVRKAVLSGHQLVTAQGVAVRVRRLP